MAEMALHAGTVALVGNLSSGKTALFHRLTCARQKVANYAGVAVERKFGLARLDDDRSVAVIDLPGTYSLDPATPDERVTLDVLQGRRAGEAAPELIVAVGALGTVYSLSAAGDAVAETLAPVLAQSWSLATAFSLLARYVFAPQCLSTLAVVKRETNSWRYPLNMAAYLFALAHAAAFVTCRSALWLGGCAMHWQSLVTTLLVSGCALYASRSLMPAGWRQRCRAALGAPATVSAGACGGCGDCGGHRVAAAARNVITVHRRPPAG